MKKITMIIALSVITLLAYTQNRTDLEQKVLKMKAKTDQVLQRTGLLFKMYGTLPGAAIHSTVLKNGATQKLDSIVSWSYDELNETWEYDWKDEYQYDAQMRATVWFEKEWDGIANEWEILDKTEIEYGADGQISSLLEYEIDDQTGQLELDSKIEIYFSTEENLDSMLIYSYEPVDQWNLEGKIHYHYNASGLLSHQDIWALNDDEVMTKSVIIRYEYNNSGQLISESSYYFIMAGVEQLFSQSQHSYNASGQLTTTIVSGLSFVTLEMVNQDRTDYQYNAIGDVAVEIDSDWNGSTEMWEEADKYEYEYSTMDFSEVAFPSFANLIFGMGGPAFKPTKVIIGDKTYEMEEGLWVQTDRSTFYYSAGSPTGIEQPENSATGFYPNPAFDEINLKWNGTFKNLKLQVFQMNGAKILEQEVSSGERVSVAHLATGVYLVKLLNGQQPVYTGKMMKK